MYKIMAVITKYNYLNVKNIYIPFNVFIISDIYDNIYQNDPFAGSPTKTLLRLLPGSNNSD